MSDKKQAINPPSIWNSNAYGFSQAVKAGDLVFVSGQVSFAATLEDQAREAFVNIKTILGAAGANLTDIVKVNIYATEEDAWDRTAEVRAEFLPSPFPAVTMVVVRALARPEIKVEIEVTAVVGAG
ncbi:MAG: RidA family protein [Dehalococcoidia bacterium]|nr:RidA family protein [Dehalococcoidia bacterium]